MSHEIRFGNVHSLSGCRLLIVEDEYLIAEDLSRTLRALGATIVGPAPAASAARSLLRALRPHCVLLDLNLNGEEAIEFALEVCALGTPVIFITGYDSAHLPPVAREIPLVRKPVKTLDLVQVIQMQTATAVS